MHENAFWNSGMFVWRASVILADHRINATASAQPVKTGATGGKVGIGASLALNTIVTDTSAQLADNAVFRNGAGLAVSAGSACRSRALESSYVIEALGYSTERARSSIRFSLGRPTTGEDIRGALAILRASQ